MKNPNDERCKVCEYKAPYFCNEEGGLYCYMFKNKPPCLCAQFVPLKKVEQGANYDLCRTAKEG